MSQPALLKALPDTTSLALVGKHRPYPRYAQSGSFWLGNLPTHWKLRRLKFVAASRPSNVDKKTVEGELTVRLCNYVDVYKNDYITPDLDFMHATADPAELAKFRLRRGDVLITKDSEEWNDIAVPAYVTQDFDDVACGYHLSQVRPRPSVMDGEYLFRAFRASGVSEQFQVAANGITRFGIAAGAIGDVLFPVPPFDEQHAIAAFLRHKTALIDALIAKKQRLVELLREKRAALISHVVTRGLNPHAQTKPSGLDWLGSIPKHWEVKRLRFVGDAYIGLTFDPVDLADAGEGVLVLRASNVHDGRVTLDDNIYVKMAIPRHIITRVGDILICSRSGSRALIGKNAMIDADSAGLTFGTFMTVFRSPANTFLSYVFNSTLFDYQSGAFLTSTINQLTLQNLYGFEVPMPPSDEQQAIATYLNEHTLRLNGLIARVKEAVDRLQEYRSALISAAVTGKIDVRNHREAAHAG